MKKSLRRSVRGGMVALGLVIACSSSNGDDDGVVSNAGNAGEPMLSFGGKSNASGGNEQAGEGSTAKAGNSSSAPAACENLEDSMCGGSSVEANFKTVNVLLVIDKSGSMEDQPEGFENNKWDALKAALGTALGRVADDVNVGLILYPYSLAGPIDLYCEERCCEVPFGAAAVNVSVQEGRDGVPAVLDALDETSPGGGTPTADALAGALAYYTSGEGASLPGEKYVLLATDGGPNCNAASSCDADQCTTNLDNQCAEDKNCCAGKLGERCLDDARVTDRIKALADEGIGTFVVGIPGTEAYASSLNAFAEAGGLTNPDSDDDAPEYYAVSAEGGVEGLVDVFESITTQLVRACDIELESAPLDRDKVNLYVDCEVVPRGDEDEPAWELDLESAPSLLRLKGRACEDISKRGAERIDVVYGCPTIK